MIVCHCAVVSCGDIAETVEQGAGTVSQVCRRTGAAQACGACVFSVRQVICEYAASATDAEEPVRAAS